jgi:hypothetical protein
MLTLTDSFLETFFQTHPQWDPTHCLLSYVHTQLLGPESPRSVIHVLNQVFPCCEIVADVYTQKEMHGYQPELNDLQCFVVLSSSNQVVCCILSVHDVCNVSSTLGLAFEVACKKVGAHGLMLSHTSGIAGKLKGQWHRISNDRALMCIPQARYDIPMLQMAVQCLQCVDSSTTHLAGGDEAATWALLEEEHRQLEKQKLDFLEWMHQSMKLFCKQATHYVDDLGLASLKYPEGNKKETVVPSSAPNMVCDVCHVFCGKNIASLSSHKRACTRHQKKNLEKRNEVVHMSSS